MPDRSIDRRSFLTHSVVTPLVTLGAGLVAATLAGCGNGGGGGKPSSSVEIFRLSGRGRRTSRAAKIHNASMRFATQADADSHRAHPGDRSRIVHITISRAQFDLLFAAGPVVDLRHV